VAASRFSGEDRPSTTIELAPGMTVIRGPNDPVVPLARGRTLAVLRGNLAPDGAVMKTSPSDVMRSLQLGPIVGVDVTRGRSITADDVARPSSVWRWILSGDWRKGPPIVALLMRAATVSTGRDLLAAREATDRLIMPNTCGLHSGDWKANRPGLRACPVRADRG